MPNKIRTTFTLILTLFFLGLSGCRGTTPESETPTTVEPVDEAAPAPKLASVVDVAEPDYCLDCHADKEQLIDTADPVVEVVSENEGAG